MSGPAFLDHLPRLLAPGRTLSGLDGGGAARGLARLVAEGPVLAVTAGPREAEALAAELNFFLGSARVFLLPADDVPPYDGLSPHPDIPRARLAALDALRRGVAAAVIAPAPALLLRVPPPEVLAGAPVVAPGEVIEPRALAERLATLGYLSVSRVEDPGGVALRGELLDVWPPGAAAPLRVEFFDDEIEQVRSFDPRTQRSGAPLPGARLLPNREEVLDRAALERAAGWLSERVGELGWGARRRRRILQDLRAGIRFAGCELYLPALCEAASPLDYARGAQLVLLEESEGAIRKAVEESRQRAQGRWDALEDAVRPLCPPALRYLGAAEVLEGVARGGWIRPVALAKGDVPPLDLGCRDNRGLHAPRPGDLATPAGALGAWLADGWRVGLVVEGAARAERLATMLRPHGLEAVRGPPGPPDLDRLKPGVLTLLIGDLPRGFHAPHEGLALVTADEISGHKIHVRGPGRARSFGQVARDASVGSFAHLKEGDLLVHQRHGVGRYLGLRKVDLASGGHSTPVDMLLLEYRGGDRMYLPVHRLDQVSRFRAGSDSSDLRTGSVRLDRLGGETWAARKQKVRDGVLKLAHELIRLEASRKVAPGRAYVGTSNRYRAFEEAFPYTETADQLAAIEATLEDLAKPEPMDRLIVGDVGFGKTEVAMRAAMRVVEEGRQVALLCPTTVLAYQHTRTLRERFSPFGVAVGLLSRFNPPAETRRVKQGLKDGGVQIALGTTSLLGRGVKFKDLGMVIVDEEHRFGVRQKERLKRLRSDVDMLSLSATPIPRTLHMALGGIRSFSIIATPPVDRLPVRTHLARYGPERVREEVMRELSRGGQVFFVHNRVASIGSVAEGLRSVVPEARVGVAHGQQDARDLEAALVDFVEGRTNVLVCTAIIESGVDMPNVNTILVNRADRFGLAQLYQLRGRVGRSHRRGYCTLLVDEETELTAQAMRRLRVLQDNTDLGAGFAIASADLDIRGAGDLLGQSQHGHIQAVGFETWVELLEDAIAEARGHSERERLDPEVELGLPAFLPEGYVPDLEERLLLYRRLAMARTVAEIRAIVDELEDRCGELPPEALGLSRLLEVRVRCRALGIARLSVLKIRVVLELSEHSHVDEARLADLKRRHPQRFKRKGDAVSFQFTPQEGARPFLFVHWLLGLLESEEAGA
jgi:transcription-repair coupling factor (superfamily II helicase)